MNPPQPHPVNTESTCEANIVRHSGLLFPLSLAPDRIAAAILEALLAPFRALHSTLVEIFTDILLHTPDVAAYPPVTEIHQLCLLVALILATLAALSTGVYYLLYGILPIAARDIRLILPRLVLGLVFATVSLPVLQLGVDLANALTAAFAPVEPDASIGELAGTGVTLGWLINLAPLLGLVVFFLLRDTYILFVAAISPLIAIGYAIPNATRYARSLSSAWFALLAVGPLDTLILRFTLILLRGPDLVGLERVTAWLFGLMGFILMLLIPYQLFGISQQVASYGRRVDRGLSPRQWRQPPGSGASPTDDWDTQPWSDDRRYRGDRW